MAKILVIGGTGSLGQAILKHIQKTMPRAQVSVLSRDEHKQQRLKREFPKVKFIIGDVRDKPSLMSSMTLVDTVFHVAALKHIDVLEANPVESVKTNVLGTINVCDAVVESGVKHFIFSSTDKAVDPINAYGYSKALSEKIITSYAMKYPRTNFKIYRWGNVIGSEGSFIKDLVRRLKNKESIPITDLRMTRFWINVSDAVKFIFKTYKRDRLIEIPPHMKSSNIISMVNVVADILGVEDFKVHYIGMRPGEKLHEVLISQHLDQTASSYYPANRFKERELKKLLLPKIKELAGAE